MLALLLAAMKQLCILRHAEAVPHQQAKDDPGRALTDHGRGQCAERAARLAKTGFDRIIASPAERTRATAEIVFAACGAVTLESRLYNASLALLLAVIAETPSSCGSLALVGHNPGMSELAEHLTGQPRHLPTASLLILKVEGEWVEISDADATIVTAMMG